MIVTGFDLSRLSRAEKVRLYALLQEKSERAAGRKLWTYYQENGHGDMPPRGLYSKHLSFFEAGSIYRQRLMLAANRVGKTEGVGGYETTLHLTGLYPDWWKGRRFTRPIRAWAAGDTSQTVRDILQEKLLGPVGAFGTGLIPRDCIVEVRAKSHGVADAVESVVVKHVSGGFSRLVFKSYDQKRKSFQGTEQDLIWLDEEPPLDVYAECLMRTMTTDGLVLLTFTPLLGMSEVVLSFLEDGRIPDEAETYVAGGKFVVMATWDDAPHLTPEKKAAMLAEMPPHQRDARTKGVPQLGAGAIYPVPEEFYLVDDFTIPVHWPRGYGLDVGWNCTAGVWGAWDRESDIIYATSVHKRGLAEPVVHAEAIKARGSWMMGAIDPASMGSGQADGKSLMAEYENLGLHLVPAINAVEAGIHDVWTRLSTGRLKIFRSCSPLVAEMRLYRRDDNGKVVKKDDHACDALRYLVHTRDDVFQTMPVQLAYPERLAVAQAPVGVVEYNPYAD